MTDARSAAIQYARENNPRFRENLKTFLKFQSISTDPQHKEDIDNTAHWVAQQLKDLGAVGVEIMPTGGHPVVYGEMNSPAEKAKTMLIYGHYDVQPIDPVDLWTSAAFDPHEVGENLYARGASDMKGQVAATLNALEAVVQSGDLPVNVKFLIEGEEEIGSPYLESFLQKHKELFKSDFALNPDTGMLGPDFPTITYALRGLAYFEIRLEGPDHDLHSGFYGGVVHNPAQVLCELIAGMHDENGRVTLPGFYDSVRELDQEERAQLARLPMDEDFYLQQTGTSMLWGENEYSPVERIGARPTLEVNGIYSGFTGEGSKTVLPAWAMAKISSRLVPDQDPSEVQQQLLQYLELNSPPTVKYSVADLASSLASISNTDTVEVKAMKDAMQQVWGKTPLFRREGGTVPVVVYIQDILGIDCVNCGFSLPDDNAHGPNEKLHLPTWERGIETLINFYHNLSM
jgi:acetylornithine deacetylase/succinyl-diaminopimelate desuccinylase-like protein